MLSACTNQAGSVSATAATPPSHAEMNSDYVIGPGDTLSIFVYENPQLSVGSLPVRPDGRISTPLVPDVTAAGLTPTQLAQVLTERLSKYEKSPVVTVMVMGFIGPTDRQIRVIGEAADPQAIPYHDNMTLLDVMIRTKGLTRFAAGNRAVILRKVPDGTPERINVRLADLLNDGDLSQNVKMQPGDTLIIPQTWF